MCTDRYPDYYKIVEEPVSLSEMRQKVAAKTTEDGMFSSLDDFQSCVARMHANACKYNLPESDVVLDASELHKLVRQRVKEFKQIDHSKMCCALSSVLDANDEAASVTCAGVYWPPG